jgi:hypothetical protein
LIQKGQYPKEDVTVFNYPQEAHTPPASSTAFMNFGKVYLSILNGSSV